MLDGYIPTEPRITGTVHFTHRPAPIALVNFIRPGVGASGHCHLGLESRLKSRFGPLLLESSGGRLLVRSINRYERIPPPEA